MATFYRWFDDKYDLCLEIARFICIKAAPTEPRHIFDEFDTADVITRREGEYMWKIEIIVMAKHNVSSSVVRDVTGNENVIT